MASRRLPQVFVEKGKPSGSGLGSGDFACAYAAGYAERHGDNQAYTADRTISCR
jgi:hypothetical protein